MNINPDQYDMKRLFSSRQTVGVIAKLSDAVVSNLLQTTPVESLKAIRWYIYFAVINRG